MSNFLLICAKGMSPCTLKEDSIILCSRANTNGKNEIWRINFTH